MDKKKTINYIGKFLMVLSIIFIVYKLYRYDLDLSRLADWRIGGGIILLILLHGANIFLLATYSYTVAVNLYSKKKIFLPKVMHVYCKANLYKYIPGNIMHFVGRNQLALDENVPHTDIILATVTEMVLLIFAAVVITLSSGISSLQLYLNSMKVDAAGNIATVVILGAICVLIAGSVLVIFRHKLWSYLSQYQEVFTGRGIQKCAVVLAICIVRLLVNAVIFMTCLHLLCEGIPVNMYTQILSLFVISWVIGFLTPGAPGGLGVREAVMCFFLGGIVGQDSILYAALVYRVICILGDMTSYLYALLLADFFPRGRKCTARTKE